MSEQQNGQNHRSTNHTDSRHVSTSISLSNVLWILITVVSVASFIFTYDTRITVLENQTDSIPAIQERLNTLRDRLKDVQSQLKTTRTQLDRFVRDHSVNTKEIENLRSKVRELQYQIKTLKTRINQLEQQVNQ